MAFLQSFLRPAKVKHTEIGHNGVEAGVGEGQLFGITFTKLEAGMTAARLLDHFG